MLVEQLPDLNLALVDLRDMNSLAISDLSTYINVPTSDELSLQITPPGYETITVDFTPLNVNIYKCVDLGITCSDSGCTPLPDGIYDVRYNVISIPNANTITPAVINKKFIKIDQIKCAYEHAYIAIEMKCVCHDHFQRGYMDELDRAKLYINGSVAECNRGNYVLSYEYYHKAEYILNTLACKFTGNCGNRGFFNNCGCCK